MLSNEQLNVLADITDTSWGKSSTANGGAKHLYSVKCTVADDVMTIVYNTLVTFAGERSFRMQKPRYDDESNKILSDVLSNIKAEFKSRTGSTLKTTEKSSVTGLELLSNPANVTRTACYRRRTLVTLDAS